MKIKVLIINACLAVSGGFSACTQDAVEEISMLTAPEIRFNFDIVQTRTSTDASNVTTFVNGDKVGIFGAVTEASQFKIVATNLRYSYNGSRWNGERFAYADDNAGMCFYAYYPYAGGVNAPIFSFSVAENQNETIGNTDGYSASDLLLAKSQGITASTETANLSFKHVLSLVEVTVTGLVANENVTSVQLRAMKTANVDLYNQTTTVDDVSQRPVLITMKAVGGNKYRAVIPAQTLKANATRFVVTTNYAVYQHRAQADAVLDVNGIQCFNVVLPDKDVPSVPDTPLSVNPVYVTLSDLTQDNIKIIGNLADYYPSAVGANDAKVSWTNQWFDFMKESSDVEQKVTVSNGVLSVVTGSNANHTWYEDCFGMTVNNASEDTYRLTFKAKTATEEVDKGFLKIFIFSKNIGSNRIFQIKEASAEVYSSFVDCSLNETEQVYNLLVDFTKVYGGVGNANVLEDTSEQLATSREKYSIVFCCYGIKNATIDVSEVNFERI